ncbi:MAG: hypothetical protein UT61_C0025G0015 [Candidatus Woesebacteria bacterium GW2011_GWA1_39_8]|uniref:Uncharacterized protein n=1 Tax=Candidatus Woesebacteria bacterium GW2011_GWA1_39_8 TaxID=1618552 RepID=A0A0G0PP61_9BACT|nr:MAG: hypothetical protein UT61_C0025G0015 [Candidatus Woesebacteria bacterium GW2011_GWA1_39_8]
MNAKEIMDNANAPSRSEIFGDMDGVPKANKMYKKYLRYHKNKYGENSEKKPPTFKEFVTWGRKKGFLKEPSVNAEGDNGKTNDKAKEIFAPEEKKVETAIKNMSKGKYIACALLIIGIAGFVYALIQPKK